MSKSKRIVLDASALIILLAKEKGWENVIPLLPRAVMSSVNIAEVAKYLIERKGLKKSLIQNMIEKLLDEVISFDSAQAYTSAELIAHTKKYGLSLGDRACLTLALNNSYSVYTADNAWKNINIDGLDIEFLR